MKHVIIALFALSSFVGVARAQVSVVADGSEDESFRRADIRFTTRDRSFVPQWEQKRGGMVMLPPAGRAG